MGCLAAAAGLGVHAAQQATEISAYHNARPCLAGAAPDADCLQPVRGAVTAVTESPGGDRIPANYSLDVKTALTTLHLTFTSDSALLGYAVDGDAAVVTMWRGVSVSVVTDGRSEVTTSVPETALARDLGNSEECCGVGAFFVIVGLAIRQNRKADGKQPMTRPAFAAAVMALVLAGLVLAIGGFALGGKPSRLGPDLIATGAALVVVIGLSVWLGFSVRRRASQFRASLAPTHGMTSDAHVLQAPVVPTAPPGRTIRTPLRTRMHPANWPRALGTVMAAWLAPTLTIAVLFGVFLTSHDGPAARAFRHAPRCVGETNLDTCVGDFTAVINGVRTPANGRNSADVSYATWDGAINAWATFDGDTSVLARKAEADKSAHAPLTVKVWRGSIVGAELGGSWHWAEGNPPGNVVPTVFLGGSFAALLFYLRRRIYRRVGLATNRQRLRIDDVGQVAVAAGSVVLLAYGFLPGAALALAALVWLALTVRQSTRWRQQAQLTSPQSA